MAHAEVVVKVLDLPQVLDVLRKADAEIGQLREMVKELRRAANDLLLNPDDLQSIEAMWALVLRDDPEYQISPSTPEASDAGGAVAQLAGTTGPACAADQT